MRRASPRSSGPCARGAARRPRGGALAAALGVVLLATSGPAHAAAVLVIGAPGAAPASITADELALVYRRQKTLVDGTRVQPVNLPAAHPLRRWFSQQLLGQPPEAMDGYWRDLYFNGIVPPFVLASEEAVIRFVAGTPGAIGYVSACPGDKRVRVLLQLDGGPPCPR